MRERPILLNAEMVRAVLDGRKTQTRRIMKVQPESNQLGLLRITDSTNRSDIGKYHWAESNATGNHVRSKLFACPYGAVGDRLWVRETFATLGNEDGCPIDWHDNLVKGGGQEAARIYRASCEQRPGNYGLWSIPDDAFWKPHTDNMQYEGTWVPSIHMQRWASRITLEITGIRVERLNSINEHDAIAEGLAEISKDGHTYKYGVPDRDGYPGTDDLGWPWHEWERYPISAYSKLWKSIYGEESWQANPWVWVIEFKRLDNADKAG